MNGSDESALQPSDRIADLERRLAAAEARYRAAIEQRDACERLAGSPVTGNAHEAALPETEATFNGLMHHLPEVVLIVGRDGRIDHANRSAWRMPAARLIGTHLGEHFNPSFRTEIAARLECVWSTEAPQLLEVQDSEDCWWLMRALVLKDGVGPDRMLVICTDVTRLKLGEESLRRSEAELRCLFDNIPDLVLLIDREGTIKFANRPSPGASIHQMLGAKGFTFIAPEFQEVCRDALAMAMASQRPQEVEMQDVFGHWWDCRLVPMPREDRSAADVMLICADVTSRKQAEISLRRSEQRFKAVAENSPNMVFIDGLDGEILYVNSMCEKLLKYSREELYSGELNAFTFVAPESQPLAAANWQHFLAGQDLPPAEYTLIAKTGERITGLVATKLMEYDGRPAVLGVVTDITRRKADESVVRESERKYRLITENLFDWIWTGHVPGLEELIQSGDANCVLDRWEWTFVSSSIHRLLGYSVEEGLHLTLKSLLTETSQLAASEHLGTALALWRSEPGTMLDALTEELELVKKTGETVWCDVSARLTRADDGELTGFEGVARDISERKDLERQLAEWLDQRRQEMAQQLHDELGQDLLGMRLMAESARKSLTSKSSPEAACLAELSAAAELAQSRLREIIKGVSPVEVAPQGLMAALEDLAGQTRRLAQIACEFHCQRAVPVDDSRVATELYFIAQEAVRNAVKHARPTSISIGLANDDHHLSLWVADDGIGMPLGAEHSAGMGLRIMRHRAAVINAALSIRPAIPQGTLVSCKLPLPGETDA
jgi:PAS domain S-box-containing protein